MADEISITVGGQVVNGNLKHVFQNVTRKFDQTTARAGAVCQDIGTTEETIPFGDGGPGYVIATNLDNTNFVRLRFSTGANAIRLLPEGGIAVFYLDSGVTLYGIANVAACKVKLDWFNA
jgi:hypothetical protein